MISCELIDHILRLGWGALCGPVWQQLFCCLASLLVQITSYYFLLSFLLASRGSPMRQLLHCGRVLQRALLRCGCTTGSYAPLAAVAPNCCSPRRRRAAENEARAFAKSEGWETEDVEEIALRVRRGRCHSWVGPRACNGLGTVHVCSARPGAGGIRMGPGVAPDSKCAPPGCFPPPPPPPADKPVWQGLRRAAPHRRHHPGRFGWRAWLCCLAGLGLGGPACAAACWRACAGLG